MWPFAVCTALDRIGITAVLTGGSAATYYVPATYQSLDVDFVFRTVPERGTLDAALSNIGYGRVPGDTYAHVSLPYTVEFPRGPLAVGRDILTRWDTVRRGDEVLHVTAVTDCVRDRFMHFWAWNDRSALEVALTVARARRDAFDLSAFTDWVVREHEADERYSEEHVAEFLRRLG